MSKVAGSGSGSGSSPEFATQSRLSKEDSFLGQGSALNTFCRSSTSGLSGSSANWSSLFGFDTLGNGSRMVAWRRLVQAAHRIVSSRLTICKWFATCHSRLKLPGDASKRPLAVLRECRHRPLVRASRRRMCTAVGGRCSASADSCSDAHCRRACTGRSVSAVDRAEARTAPEKYCPPWPHPRDPVASCPEGIF